jgi:phosphoserine phosphatase
VILALPAPDPEPNILPTRRLEDTDGIDELSALHVFDMDGTLLSGTTASLLIAAAHGSEAELRMLEARFAAGLLDTTAFATEIHALWSDLTAEMVRSAFAGGAWLTGIEEVTADIRARGERSAVITMSPDFFADHLYAWGFDTVAASRFPRLPLRSPIDPSRILTPADKVRITDELRGGLPLSRCVAYGDSLSDAPLFAHLTATVAVNADHHLEDLAAAGYRGGSLREAYALGRAQLPSRS